MGIAMRRPLSVVALAAGIAGVSACSSVAMTEGTGGRPGVEGGTGGGLVIDVPPVEPCFGAPNPDTAPGGACAPDCQSVSCGRPCTQDCCTTCGIDQMGSKICVCRTPGGPYTNCSCIQPPSIPGGLTGGSCSPQGVSTTSVPVDSAAVSLRGQPCRATGIVCFTLDSTPASERGCICMADGLMHCGAVSHWFTNVEGETFWQ